MSEEVARRAFEPFFTTKPVGVGTGLGLSVAFFIVTEQHRGKMAVQSAPDGGARFVLRLPRQGNPNGA
jgi:signal transduction histidine kinase